MKRKLFPCLTLFLIILKTSFSQGLETKICTDSVSKIDEMPQYPGGDEALLRFIGDEVVYPRECKKNGIMGIVFISYVVNELGEVDDINIFLSSEDLFNEEAIRVIQSIRGYKSGKRDGIPVKVKFTVPIKFILNDGSEAEELKLNQNLAIAYYKIALKSYSFGCPSMSKKFLEKAIFYGKNWFYQGYLSLGDLRFNEGEYQNALDDYTAALGISDTLVSAWQGKGKSLMAMNRLDEASIAFQNAIRLRPKSFDAFYNLGVIRLTERKFEDGITYFSKSIELDPSSGLSYYNRGMCAARMRKQDDACHDWIKAKNLGVKEAFLVAENCPGN